MGFAGSFFAPIFRGKSRSLVFLHSFPEGFRFGRYRKGAEMNQKNTEIDTSTMGGRIKAMRIQKGWSQEETEKGRKAAIEHIRIVALME